MTKRGAASDRASRKIHRVRSGEREARSPFMNAAQSGLSISGVPVHWCWPVSDSVNQPLFGPARQPSGSEKLRSSRVRSSE